MDKAQQVMRATGLETRARSAFAAERLAADNGTDHRAVDVQIADMRSSGDAGGDTGDAAVQPHGQAIAERVDRSDRAGQIAGFPGNDVEQGAEPFRLQVGDVIQCDGGGRNEIAGRRDGYRVQPAGALSLAIGFQPAICRRVDDRTHIGGGIDRVAHHQRVHGAFEHGQSPVGDIRLHQQQPQRRTALSGGPKGAGDDILHNLFGQRG